MHLNSSQILEINTVLLSYTCCSKVPQTGWLKTTERYSFTVLRLLALLLGEGFYCTPFQIKGAPPKAKLLVFVAS